MRQKDERLASKGKLRREIKGGGMKRKGDEKEVKALRGWRENQVTEEKQKKEEEQERRREKGKASDEG